MRDAVPFIAICAALVGLLVLVFVAWEVGKGNFISNCAAIGAEVHQYTTVYVCEGDRGVLGVYK